MIENIFFALCLTTAVVIFSKQLLRIRKNIQRGREVEIPSEERPERWRNMIRVALGQSKMTARPIAGILHIIVYVGFVIINIEVIEIIIDGLFGTHRILGFLGGLYDVLIGSFEILAALVLLACVVFIYRRIALPIARFRSQEMNGWPKKDALYILVFEIVLMTAFLLMNASDLALQEIGEYPAHGAFPVSQMFLPLMEGMASSSLHLLERSMWWIHILGILFFLNYIIYSKHLHILLAFPTTFFAKIELPGRMKNLDAVKKEVALMLDPDADPFAAPEGSEEDSAERFGVKDVIDLDQNQLLSAYSCTECGRCTSVCPANLTGKLLSPRKIMMDSRDRLEEWGSYSEKNPESDTDGKTLLDDYISREELWACTSCNACTEACPININPMEIILDMRQYLVMEESAAPTELNNIFTNIENNGAPWQFAQEDRLNWATEE